MGYKNKKYCAPAKALIVLVLPLTLLDFRATESGAEDHSEAHSARACSRQKRKKALRRARSFEEEEAIEAVRRYELHRGGSRSEVMWRRMINFSL